MPKMPKIPKVPKIKGLEGQEAWKLECSERSALWLPSMPASWPVSLYRFSKISYYIRKAGISCCRKKRSKSGSFF